MRSGLRSFINKVTKSGTGTTTILAAPGAGKRIRIHSLYAVCDADNVPTYGKVHFFDAQEQLIAELVAVKGFTQVLKDAAAPPITSYAPNAQIRLTVEVVTGNGFADTNTFVWGVYDIEG